MKKKVIKKPTLTQLTKYVGSEVSFVLRGTKNHRGKLENILTPFKAGQPPKKAKVVTLENKLQYVYFINLNQITEIFI